MTRQERAKQFMPFDAMKGLSEALREREEKMSRVERRSLDDEEKERISNILNRVYCGMKVQILCYRDYHEKTIQGTVTRLDPIYKYIKVDDIKIFFDDIYDIEFI